MAEYNVSRKIVGLDLFSTLPMAYLSELLKTKVRDSSDKTVGRFIDALVETRPGEYAPLLYLMVEPKRYAPPIFIPYEYVATIGREEITLKNLITNIPQELPAGQFTYLNRDIMDEQIVDLDGARVVRVNDLKMGLFENMMSVLGIDVSFKGLLRRLGLGGLDLFDVFGVHLIDWRKAHLVKGSVQVNTIAKDLVRLHPADLANIIEDLTIKQGSTLVDALDSKAAAQVMEEIDPEIQRMIINYLGPERSADIVESMSVDEAVDLLQMLPKSAAKRFLSFLQGAKSKKVEKLIRYPTNTAGGLMTTDYLSASPSWTVKQTIDEIKKASPYLHSLLYIYITDDENSFLGTASLRTLLVTPPEKTLKEIMKRAPRASILRVHNDIDRVIRIMTKYNLYTAAVLEKDTDKIVGMVTIDDVMRHLVPNA